nr:PIN domain-containing protein [Vineibacter terrae]
MREKFPGYFRPTSDAFDTIWTKALIVPDTNVLLHTLRYRKETRDQVLNIFKTFSPRVWVPHTVCLEFLNGWREVDTTSRELYRRLQDELKKFANSYGKICEQNVDHHVLDTKEEKKKFDSFVRKRCQFLQKQSKEHPSREEGEAVLERVADAIGDNIGQEPSQENFKRWAAEAKERFGKKIPPGYKDNDKRGDAAYRDYYIWKELIQVAEQRHLPVIFITDDSKEDWYLRIEGKTVGPRPELVNEFKHLTSQAYYSYPFRKFVETSGKYISSTLSQEAFDEIKQTEEQIQQEEAAREHSAAAQKFGDRRDLQDWPGYIGLMSGLRDDFRRAVISEPSFSYVHTPSDASVLNAGQPLPPGVLFNNPRTPWYLDSAFLQEMVRRADKAQLIGPGASSLPASASTSVSSITTQTENQKDPESEKDD